MDDAGSCPECKEVYGRIKDRRQDVCAACICANTLTPVFFWQQVYSMQQKQNLQIVPDDKYFPIDCGFYDHIEAAIVQKRTVWLEYRDDAGDLVCLQTRLQDTQTSAGAEFLILPDGVRIRMDRLISLDGTALLKKSSCA